MKERMAVFSACFDVKTLETMKTLTQQDGYSSVGEFVRHAVYWYIDGLMKDREKRQKAAQAME